MRARSRFGAVASVVVAIVLVVSVAGCSILGRSASDADRTTKELCHPDAKVGGELDRWMLDSCPAIAKPVVITEQEFTPAIVGEHARPPDGPGWDWDRILDVCRHIHDSLPPIYDAATRVPESAQAVARPLRTYAGELSEFTNGCIEVAPHQDYEQMRPLTAHLNAATRAVNEVESALLQAAGVN